YVAEHEHDLAFPFRRYQMQRVYRGERAQRGRFREFYQCDIDVVGKDALSIRHDAEIPAVINAVFEALAIGEFTISLNHRKLLRGFMEGLGIDDGERQGAVLRELDKLDKRGAEAVQATLAGGDFGLDAAAVGRLMAFPFDRPRRCAGQARCTWSRRAEPGTGPRRPARSAGTASRAGRARVALRAQPVHRARPGLLHRHRLRDHAGCAPGNRFDLFRWTL